MDLVERRTGTVKFLCNDLIVETGTVEYLGNDLTVRTGTEVQWNVLV